MLNKAVSGHHIMPSMKWFCELAGFEFQASVSAAAPRANCSHNSENPELYGDAIMSLALDKIRGKEISLASFVKHQMVTRETWIQSIRTTA